MMGTSSMIWTKLLVVLSCVSVAVWGYFPSYSVPYCNHNFNTRKIPPLDANQASLVKSLQQVQVVVRHGARTPYKKYQCWANYDVIWNNCNVTELMLESPSYSSQNRPATWLFRKIYNASPNYLGGNCFTGQLLLEGYDQEEANGGFLKQAYINDGPLSIFPTDQWMSINTTQFVYLRSDDEQRTLMSGQVLLHAMFNVSLLLF